MINLDIPNSIEKIISKYEYGQFNILDAPIKMEYDLVNKKISFENFYRHDYLLNKDTCYGLMNKAYNDIRLTHRNLFVSRAFGNDDKYFKNSDSNHCFLLVNDVDMMNYCSTIGDDLGITHALSTNPLIVDPSFKTITRASESEYVIKSLMNHSWNSRLKNSQSLNSENGEIRFLPLIINDSKEILHLAPDFNSEHLLAIGVQKPNMDFRDILLHPIESKKLDELFKTDSKSYKFIDYFRNLPKSNITKI